MPGRWPPRRARWRRPPRRPRAAKSANASGQGHHPPGHHRAPDPGERPDDEAASSKKSLGSGSATEHAEQHAHGERLNHQGLPEEPAVHRPDTRRAALDSPLPGRLAQLVERLPYKQEVACSIRAPPIGTGCRFSGGRRHILSGPSLPPAAPGIPSRRSPRTLALVLTTAPAADAQERGAARLPDERVLTLYSPKLHSEPYVHEQQSVGSAPRPGGADASRLHHRASRSRSSSTASDPTRSRCRSRRMMVHHLLYFAPAPGRSSYRVVLGLIGLRGEEEPRRALRRRRSPEVRPATGSPTARPPVARPRGCWSPWS